MLHRETTKEWSLSLVLKITKMYFKGSKLKLFYFFFKEKNISIYFYEFLSKEKKILCLYADHILNNSKIERGMEEKK